MAAEQIESYLSEHDLFRSLQSAYQQHHGTKTALLKVKNNILMNMEDQQEEDSVFAPLLQKHDLDLVFKNFPPNYDGKGLKVVKIGQCFQGWIQYIPKNPLKFKMNHCTRQNSFDNAFLVYKDGKGLKVVKIGQHFQVWI